MFPCPTCMHIRVHTRPLRHTHTLWTVHATPGPLEAVVGWSVPVFLSLVILLVYR